MHVYIAKFSIDMFKFKNLAIFILWGRLKSFAQIIFGIDVAFCLHNMMRNFPSPPSFLLYCCIVFTSDDAVPVIDTVPVIDKLAAPVPDMMLPSCPTGIGISKHTCTVYSTGTLFCSPV